MNPNLFFHLMVAFGVLLAAVPVSKSSELSKTRDCTVLDAEVEADPNLTTEENIKRLTDMFYESVNTVTHCDPPSATSDGGGGGGGGGVRASASPDLVGTEEVEKGPSQSSTQGKSDAELSAIESEINSVLKESSSPTNALGSTEPINQVSSPHTGALPDDIPPTDNDSVFEVQIRKAAENERDPIVRKNLWNEYRKYKGIPIKE